MAESFRGSLAKATKEVAGATFWIKKTVTSSAILTTAVAITNASSGGELMIEDIVLKTDGTGLATGTTFRIVSNNANGTSTVFLTRIARLGANKNLSLYGVYGEALNESATLGINVPTVLEIGKTLSVRNTDSASTGGGTVDIYIQFRKLSDTAKIQAA